VKRNRRAAVEDLWLKTVRDENGNSTTVPSAQHGRGSRWRARYVDGDGREHAKQFKVKAKAQAWLDQQTSKIVQGKHIAPRDAKVTVKDWCELWFEGYKGHRPNTVNATRTMIRLIVREFGDQPLSDVRPSSVKMWCARLKTDGYAVSTISRAHSLTKQIFEDAVFDGLLGANPCSRRTSPPAPKQKPYVVTAEQVWNLYDAVPERMQAAILLGAFAGLRIGEASGLRVSDVDFMRGVVHPRQQWGGEPLKNAASDAPIPIPQDLALLLAKSVEKFPSDMMVTSAQTGRCCPNVLQCTITDLRDDLGLPAKFNYHDLRHFFGSMLIASGADIVKVQHRMRHASASTTLNVYAHLLPDSDESTKDAVSAAISARQKKAN
jgi:integrase